MQNDAVEQIQNLQDVIRYLSTERKGQDLQIINLSQLLAAAEARAMEAKESAEVPQTHPAWSYYY